MAKPQHQTRRRLFVAAALLALCAAWRGMPASAQSAGHGAMAGHAGHAMTEAEMARQLDAHYATHPVTGTAAAPTADPADTVFLSNFIMNSDGNLTTQVDTVTIVQNESVLFQWVGGIHTTTNGTGPLDPLAGTIWDQPITSASPQWVQSFPDEGLFPFFCSVHPGTMRGYVRVLPAVGVTPLPGDSRRLGFLAAPAPNPTTGRVSFRFALREAGRAVAEVFDVRGRRVAGVMDEPLGAGSYAAVWDGRTEAGVAAAPGVYRLLLRLPGFSESRQVVVTR
jgi:plastocyanin